MIIAAGLALLVARRSRRGQWDDQFATQRDGARWVLANLLPAVISPAGPASAQSVQWSGAQPTLEQLEQSLAGLTTNAPDEERRAAATGLRQSLADLRATVDTDLALRSGTSAIPADAASLGTSAAAVQASRDRFAAALAKASEVGGGTAASATPPPGATGA